MTQPIKEWVAGPLAIIESEEASEAGGGDSMGKLFPSLAPSRDSHPTPPQSGSGSIELVGVEGSA